MRTGAGFGLGFVLGLAVAWALGRVLRDLDAVVVDGRSMAPALEPGDRLLVESWTFRRRAPRPGEIVLAGDPRTPRRELVKRVAALQDDRVALRGDARQSTDSRIFGPLPVSAIRWRAIVRYWPIDRAAWLSR
jgi:nickel-type superoxide dismutase maturation protease